MSGSPRTVDMSRPTRRNLLSWRLEKQSDLAGLLRNQLWETMHRFVLRINYSLTVVMASLLLFASPSFGQQRRIGPPPWTMANSPEYHLDGSISFRIWAPHASKVSLESELVSGAPSDLTVGEDDIWSLTVKPDKVGLFKYRFLVDEVITLDPTNTMTEGRNSLVFIPGKEAEFYRRQAVPHGVVHRHFYYSNAIETDRPVSIYTPPAYRHDGDEVYPVLFLFHGSGGTDQSWIDSGQANIILDNLIAESTADEMVVVFPYGHTVEPGTSGWPFVQEKGDFIEDFLNDLLPFVESQYRISPLPENRAVAGYSMGGYHSLKIGLGSMDTFSHVGVFSWGPRGDWYEEHTPDFHENPALANEKLDVFWIACGEDDFLYPGVRQFHTGLDSLGVEHTYLTTKGGHSMTNWRAYLREFARLIFPR